MINKKNKFNNKKILQLNKYNFKLYFIIYFLN